MFVEGLSIQNLRSLDLVSLNPKKGINILLGKNNAGKTTILEAIYIASRLKSFKQTATQDLIKHEQKASKIRLNVVKIGKKHSISIEKSLNSQNLVRNNTKIIGAKDIARLFPVQALTFGTENIINQHSEQRRNILDWGLFHVKPDYLQTLQRYQRCLKHRNFLLKRGKEDELDYWTKNLAENGESITVFRKEYFGVLQQSFKKFIQAAEKSPYKPHPDVFGAEIEFYKGWGENEGLLEELNKELKKDKAVGFTTHGAHKADITIKANSLHLKKTASMSTQVIVSLFLMLSQAEVFHVKHGYRPILLIDDLFFGIDDTNLMLVVELLIQAKAQCFLTAPDSHTEKLKAVCKKTGEIALYALENQDITNIEVQ